jgi:hypothetical protein
MKNSYIKQLFFYAGTVYLLKKPYLIYKKLFLYGFQEISSIPKQSYLFIDGDQTSPPHALFTEDLKKKARRSPPWLPLLYRLYYAHDQRFLFLHCVKFNSKHSFFQWMEHDC